MELESAIERLYSDESLTSDVDDATAKPLLKWAEAQLPVIIAGHPDDSSFDAAFITFKKLIKSVARYIDGNATMDDVERAERTEKIQTFAGDLGLTVDMAALAHIGAAVSGPDIVAQVLGTPEPVVPPTVMTFPASAADIAAPTQPSQQDDAQEQDTQPTAALPQWAVAQADSETSSAADAFALPDEGDAPHDAETVSEADALAFPDEDDAPHESETPADTPEAEAPKPAPENPLRSFFQRITDMVRSTEPDPTDTTIDKE